VPEVRAEEVEDHDAVRALLIEAFDGDDGPVRLVELLRSSEARPPLPNGTAPRPSRVPQPFHELGHDDPWPPG
jgi:hypothetical protein